MAFIYRIIVKRLIHISIGFIIGFLYVEFNEAHADYNGIEEYPSANSISWHPTFTAACQATFDRGPAGANASYYYVSIDSSTEFPICRINVFQGSNYQDGFTLQKYKNCSGTRQLWNSGQGAGICSGDLQCISPQVPNQANTACETPNNCLQFKGEVVDRLFTSQGSSIICRANCELSVIDQVCVTGGCSSRAKITGSTCLPTPDKPDIEPTDPIKECLAKGQSYGTVNGVIVCAKAGTPSTPPITQTNNTDKTTTTTTNNTTNNTTTTTTTMVNGATGEVTKTTTTTPEGGTPTVEQKTQDKNSFCEENPTSKICKDDVKSTFGGSCAGSFQCDGDAIQCSIAQEQHKRNCTLYETETTLTQEGRSMLASAGNNPAAVENRENINISDMVNEGNNIGSGSFQDKVIPLKGAGIVLPFSKLNEIMQLLGAFLLAGAYLNAARIVGVR